MAHSKKEIAANVFKAHKNVKKVYVTSDGNAFINKNAKELHLKTCGKKLLCEEFIPSDVQTPKQPKPTAEERVANVSKLDTIEKVQDFLKGEKAVTVKTAGEDRIKELEVLAKSGTDDPETRGNNVTDTTNKTDK